MIDNLDATGWCLFAICESANQQSGQECCSYGSYKFSLLRSSRHTELKRSCTAILFKSRHCLTISWLCTNVAIARSIERHPSDVAMLLTKRRCNEDVKTTSLYLIKTSEKCSYIVDKTKQHCN